MNVPTSVILPTTRSAISGLYLSKTVHSHISTAMSNNEPRFDRFNGNKFIHSVNCSGDRCNDLKNDRKNFF